MYTYLLDTGVIVPDTVNLQTTVQDEWYNAFGDDLVVTANTPQGVLITAEVAARATFLQNNASLANQINPNLAGGVFLDAIGQLTGTERFSATYSSATVELSGVAGTVIPAGSLVANDNGDQFASQINITLDGSGSGSGVFVCTTAGPITALANTLTNIIDGVLGWETANNPADAALGAYLQSDAAFRTNRKVRLAAQGNSISEAIIASVQSLSPLITMSFRDNYNSTTTVIDGVTMLPNSIYCCVSSVAGVTLLQIAQAIYAKKTGGAQYTNGASTSPQSQTVVDPYSGQSTIVKFDQSNLVPILVQVTYSSTTAIVDPTDSVVNAILAYAAGLVNGQPGFAVGKAVSPFEISGAITSYVPNLFIKKVLISKTTSVDLEPVEIPINLWEQATTDATLITVLSG